MQTMYALAELTWPSNMKPSLKGGRLCTPAHFDKDNNSDWSLCLWLDKPACPGETVTVPVMPLVTEAGPKLLEADAKFELFLGPKLLAPGRIVSVASASQEDLNSVFHLPNSYD